MFSRVILFLITFTFCLSGDCTARINFSNFKGQTAFLDSLLKELEKKAKRFDENQKEDLDRYKGDIESLKKTLDNIDIENAKSSGNDEELKKLVDDYNAKMKELEKSYKFIMSKLKKQKHKTQYLPSKKASFSEIDSLNCQKKRRKIKDARQFKPLEIVELKPTELETENGVIISKPEE